MDLETETMSLIEDSKDAFVDYDFVAKLLKLNPLEEIGDRCILKTCCDIVENYIGEDVREEDRLFIGEVKNGFVILDGLSPHDINTVRNLNTREIYSDGWILDGRRVYFENKDMEGQSVYIAYKSGWTKERIPEDIKYCVLISFIEKEGVIRKAGRGEIEIEDCANIMGEGLKKEAKEILGKYKRKSL